MENKKISIGVLGAANIALKSVVPAIEDLKDCFILAGIASRTKNKTDMLIKNFDFSIYHTYSDLLNSDNIEAVYIPLPNSMHSEWIEKSLLKGLHVLVEKSMACSSEEVVRLNILAEKNGLALIENFQFRFHPQLKTLLKLLRNGEIGDLRYIRSSFEFPPFADKNNIRYNRNLGGGALLDAGAYPIKISQVFLGNDLNVKAASMMKDNELGVDIWGGGFIKNKYSSIFSEISFGFDNYYQCSVELFGSKGKISTNRIFTAPSDYRPQILIENGKKKKLIEIEESNHFVNMLLFFNDCIYSKELRMKEYESNINQARLIEEFKIKSNE